jgi:hypothetical protein
MKKLIPILLCLLPLVSVHPATETLRPSADGTNTEWTKSGLAYNYQCVRDQNATTYVSVPLDSKTDLYNIPSPTTITQYDTITNVGIWISAKHSVADIAHLITVCRPTTTNYYSADFALTTSAANYETDWATNPQTSAAWTLSDITALQIGISTYFIDIGSVTVTDYEVWVVITYSVGAVGYPCIRASNAQCVPRASNTAVAVEGKQ